MSTTERWPAKLVDALRDNLPNGACDCAECIERIRAALMELFPGVVKQWKFGEEWTTLPLPGSTATRYVLTTAPEPIADSEETR